MSDIQLNATRPVADLSGKQLPVKKEQAANLVEQSKALADAEVSAKPKPAEDAQKTEQPVADEQAVQEVVAKLNDHVQSVERKLNFQMDEDSGRTVVKVYDKSSNELIRQMPTEQALELARNLKDFEPFGLFSAQV